MQDYSAAKQLDVYWVNTLLAMIHCAPYVCSHQLFSVVYVRNMKIGGSPWWPYPPSLLSLGSYSLLLCSTIPCIIGEGARLMHQNALYWHSLAYKYSDLILTVGIQQQGLCWHRDNPSKLVIILTAGIDGNNSSTTAAAPLASEQPFQINYYLNCRHRRQQ